FFQAEDGIRDRNVTGVQTCALPISQARTGNTYAMSALGGADSKEAAGSVAQILCPKSPSSMRVEASLRRIQSPMRSYPGGHQTRSEERRVGKGRRVEGVR